jgi:hypothetical protein
MCDEAITSLCSSKRKVRRDKKKKEKEKKRRPT